MNSPNLPTHNQYLNTQVNSDKQWNYVSDINSGVYSNNSGLTLVTWDLTSIYNAAGLSDVSDLYLAVPIVMVATCSGLLVVLSELLQLLVIHFAH